MHNLYQYFLFLLLPCFLMPLHSTTLQAQDTEFEKWKKQQEAEFQEYQDQFDKEFIEMLENTWSEVGINKGSDFYRETKPVTIPKAPPRPTTENEAPVDRSPLRETLDLSIDFSESPASTSGTIKIREETSPFGTVETRNSAINFFSTTISLEYPAKLKELYSPNDFSLTKTDNKQIADFWDSVSLIDHSPIVNYAQRIKKDLQLNDWGYVLLLNDFAHTIYEGYHPKLVTLYNWFLLTRSGYQVRIGYDQHAIYLLYGVKYDVFNTKYYTLDGQQFYIINLDDTKKSPSSIFTYSGTHQQQNKKLDFTISEFPVFGSQNDRLTKELSFSFKEKDYTIPISINKNLITYFEYYPLTELPLFFSASMSNGTKKTIYEHLAPIVSEMTEVEAVNFLLRFVQTAFDYKTDQNQFNREKYMLPEETLYYPYSDCDDRSILFANLVQELVGIDVIGLRYSKHLATAVAFSDNIDGDSYTHSGTTYTVADPTYINATVGMTMSQYENEQPEIVALN